MPATKESMQATEGRRPATEAGRLGQTVPKPISKAAQTTTVAAEPENVAGVPGSGAKKPGIAAGNPENTAGKPANVTGTPGGAGKKSVSGLKPASGVRKCSLLFFLSLEQRGDCRKACCSPFI